MKYIFLSFYNKVVGSRYKFLHHKLEQLNESLVNCCISTVVGISLHAPLHKKNIELAYKDTLLCSATLKYSVFFIHATEIHCVNEKIQVSKMNCYYEKQPEKLIVCFTETCFSITES